MTRGTKEGGYREKYAAYAERFASNERTIKRWVSTGRAAHDLPPLDSPRLMPPWWSRHMKNAVPAGISRAAAKDGPPEIELPIVNPAPPAARSAPAATVQLDLPPAAPPLPPLEILTGADAGLAEELERAKSRSATAHSAWEREMRADNPDQGRIDLAHRQCQLATENVRKLQKDANQEAIAMRDYLPRREIEQVVGELGQQLKSRIDALGPTLARLLGVPFADEAATTWQTELDDLFASLHGDLFPAAESA